MRPARRAAIAGWTVTIATGVATATALAPGRRRVVTVVQSLLPWSVCPALPIAVAAAAFGRRRLAVSAAAVAAAGVSLCVPLVRGRCRAAPSTTASISIGHANLLYGNSRAAEAAEALLGRSGLDVMTFSEYTPLHAEVLHAAPSAAQFPHRIEKARPLASGTALWSRYPVVERPGLDLAHQVVVADVNGPDAISVIVIHTQSPIVHHAGWLDDLQRLATSMPGERPSVMIGDFNAAWWHPAFRRLLRGRWRDAHIDRGRGLSGSWPVSRWMRPFVRLDHALVDERLVVVDVVELDVAGSDHRGLVVSVAPAR